MNVFQIMRLPDAFTLLNVVFGFCALLKTAQGTDQGSLQIAVIFIILALAADGLDGHLARRFGSSPLGANLDSLADLVSFGVAPAFMALQAFHFPTIAWLAGIFYVICGTLRLARFNITSKNDQFFEGLPIPAAGIALSGSVLLGRPTLSLLMMVLLALLMVSSISYVKVRDPKAVVLGGLVFLAAGVLIWQQNDIIYAGILLIAVIVIYLMSPVVITRLQKGK